MIKRALSTFKIHQLEQKFKGDCQAAASYRRQILFPNSKNIPTSSDDFDTKSFYNQIHGVNCENVIGFVPIPVGVLCNLNVDQSVYNVPLATTEGALVASLNRGARAMGHVSTYVTKNGMTRSPVLSFPSAGEAVAFVKRLNVVELQAMFSKTTSHGSLTSVDPTVVGRNVYLRFRATTGDAMGMNMVGKGVNECISNLLVMNPHAKLLSLSSNMCTDKKPSAINWITGRGRSVVAETFIEKDVLRDILHTDAKSLIRTHIAKNLVGSALAGSIGGNNAHAANVVAAIYLATGQDPAQVVTSSNCMLTLEENNDGDLFASVTMPSIEVGTVGGGTSLAVQKAFLEALNIAGPKNGKNAETLARIVATAVLAGELSLNAALTQNALISAHMALNRKKTEAPHNISII